ncbi:UV DNA damage repair endonuclease UvsE [Pseudalkalibacillus sp. SCS-8]|uniref:UV DNA damage repair endonuclease UvsE n=1 Tax=Pseudalkalibacillus nanhaiensis TaxID=3115291 RepID=UPI0032D9DED5
MILRFGYVSTALNLWESTPAHTLTFTNWKKLDKNDRKEKLLRVTAKNIENTKRAVYYNIAQGIHVYRLSSSIVPLATHPEVLWDYITPFRDKFKEIGELIQKYSMRVSFHPNQYTLFTSPNNRVTENAIRDMEYHYEMLKMMGVHKQANMNIHVGGVYGDKSTAIERFHENIEKLDRTIKHQITLENDDKTYTSRETLDVCKAHSLPFVFDYHHHWANPGEDKVDELLPEIFSTWDKVDYPPKFHLSSPKTDKEYRAHAEYVDIQFALPFIKSLIQYGEDADIMIEAKRKDKAALQLVEELASIRGFKRIDGAVIKIK